jgi:hypothetical protein
MIYRAPDGKEYPSIFEPYHAPCGITWICLKTGERDCKSFVLTDLYEVKPERHAVEAVDMGIVFTCAEPQPIQGCAMPPRSIVLWKPVISLTLDMLASVNYAQGVEIRLAA